MKVELEHALAPFRIWNFGEHMVFRAEHFVMMKYVTKPPITGQYGVQPEQPYCSQFQKIRISWLLIWIVARDDIMAVENCLENSNVLTS